MENIETMLSAKDMSLPNVLGLASSELVLKSKSGKSYTEKYGISEMTAKLVDDPINVTYQDGAETWKYPVVVNNKQFAIKVVGKMRPVQVGHQYVFAKVHGGVYNDRVWVNADAIHSGQQPKGDS